MQRLLFTSFLALGLIAAGSVSAQEFPNKPITIVVANAPGDLADLSARILAPEMSKALNVPVVVENKPGAGTLVGTMYVARQAPADGYTIAAISVNALLILPLTLKEAQLDPLKELPPFVNLVAGKLVLAANAQQSWKTFPELVAYAKANPGKLNYGSSSSTTRLLTEVLLRDRGLEIVYIPYASTAANILALTQGENQLGFTTEALALSSAPAIRVLAQTGATRSANFKDAPTFAELGFPQIPGSAYSFNLRAGTPKAAVDKLHAAVTRALQAPDVRTALEKLSVEVAGPTTPDAVLKAQTELAANYTAAAKAIGLQPQ